MVAERAAEQHGDTVESLGRNCHLPGSFQGALHAFLHTSEEGEDRWRQQGKWETMQAMR